MSCPPVKTEQKNDNAMSIAHIIFLFIGLLYFLQIPLSQEFASAIVPGWHVTVYPPYMIDTMLLGLWIFLLAGAYWVLKQRNHKVNRHAFVAHLLLTLPFVMFYVLRNELLVYTIIRKDDNLLDLSFYLSAPLFVVGQTIFLTYCIRSFKSRRTKV